jgi:hypothetical protein
VIAAHGLDGARAFREVFFICAALAAVAALVGLGLTRTLTKES